ncbi:MAG: hypothetical protein KAJ95_08640 [Gammaproteobacteria bacterium]|nr:hypothetical protein [Gammaproteobacteria bacterium]
MANEDIKDEMELLRKQLDEMKKERQAQLAEDAAKDAAESKKQADEGDKLQPDSVSEEDVADSHDDLVAQFKGLLESIDEDIKDTKPTTLFAVFALGVLVGRL